MALRPLPGVIAVMVGHLFHQQVLRPAAVACVRERSEPEGILSARRISGPLLSFSGLPRLAS